MKIPASAPIPKETPLEGTVGLVRGTFRETEVKEEIRRFRGAGSLVSSRLWVDENAKVSDVAFEIAKLDTVFAFGIVDAEGRAIGLVVKRDFQELLAQLYWRDVHKNDPIRLHVREVLHFSWDMNIFELAEMLLEDVSDRHIRHYVVTARGGAFYGTFSSIDLLRYLSRQTQKDIEGAKMLQQRLTPGQLHQSFEGGSAHGLSQMALGVGGDFMQVRPNGTRVLATVSDVSGKGVSASLLTATLAGMLEPMGEGVQETGPLLDRVNRFLSRTFDRERFVTSIVLDWDPVGRQVDVFDRGHALLFLVRARDEEWVFHDLIHEGATLPLGVDEESFSRRAQLALEPGDLLVAITDGILEQRNEKGEEFGKERFFRVLYEILGAEPIDEVPMRILSEILEFKGKSHLQDDLTLLILEQK